MMVYKTMQKAEMIKHLKNANESLMWATVGYARDNYAGEKARKNMANIQSRIASAINKLETS